MNEDLWTAQRTARYLGLHEDTVYKRAKRGEIPSVKVGKKSVRFEPEAVKEYAKRE